MPASMHNAAADALAESVMELRKQAGLSQRQLAASLGREQNFVARVEQGQRRLDLVEWVQICRALKVDPEAEIAGLVRRIVKLVPQRCRR